MHLEFGISASRLDFGVNYLIGNGAMFYFSESIKVYEIEECF